MKKTIRSMLSLCAFSGAVLVSGAAHADVSSKDFKLVTKAVGFMKSGPSGSVDVIIVYDGGNAASKSDADALNGVLGGGMTEKGVTYNPVMTDISSLGSVPAGSIVYVANGMSAHHSKIGSAASSAGVLAVSVDRSCVDAGACSMFVSSSPKVEIVLNKGVVDGAGIEFQAAFKMMVTEI